MMSDGSGDVPMDRLGEGQGKTKRVGVSASCSVTKMINVLDHNILYADVCLWAICRFLECTKLSIWWVK